MRDTATDDVLFRDTLFERAETGEIVTRDGVGVTPGLSPEVWLGEQKDKHPHWWPEAVGGGATGSGAGSPVDNPFRRGSVNITEASKLLQSQPTRARQLAAAARASGDADAGALSLIDAA